MSHFYQPEPLTHIEAVPNVLGHSISTHYFSIIFVPLHFKVITFAKALVGLPPVSFRTSDVLVNFILASCLQLTLRWRHNGRIGVSNHQPNGCLLKRLFRCRSKKTSKLRVTGLCAGNSPATDEFPAQMASNAENVSIWWRHHDTVTTPDKNQVKRIALYILRNFANKSVLLQWISTYLWGWTHHNDEKPSQAQEFDIYSINRYQMVIFWWVLCHRKIGTSWMPIWLFNN